MSPVAGVSRVVIRLRLEISRRLKHARSETCENISTPCCLLHNSKHMSRQKRNVLPKSQMIIMACEGEGHNRAIQGHLTKVVLKNHKTENIGIMYRAWY